MSTWAGHIGFLKLSFSLLVRNRDVHCLLGNMAATECSDRSHSTYPSCSVTWTLLPWGDKGWWCLCYFSLNQGGFVMMVGVVLWEFHDRVIKSERASIWVSWDIWLWHPARRLWGSSGSREEMLPLVFWWAAPAELGGSCKSLPLAVESPSVFPVEAPGIKEQRRGISTVLCIKAWHTKIVKDNQRMVVVWSHDVLGWFVMQQ